VQTVSAQSKQFDKFEGIFFFESNSCRNKPKIF